VIHPEVAERRRQLKLQVSGVAQGGVMVRVPLGHKIAHTCVNSCACGQARLTTQPLSRAAAPLLPAAEDDDVGAIRGDDEERAYRAGLVVMVLPWVVKLPRAEAGVPAEGRGRRQWIWRRRVTRTTLG